MAEPQEPEGEEEEAAVKMEGDECEGDVHGNNNLEGVFRDCDFEEVALPR